MNANFRQRCKQLVVLALAVAAGLLGGCDEDEYDHEPPAGQGTLVVDNFTGDRLQVYLDGELVESVTAGKHRFYDLSPGLRRVVLDGDDVRRTWAGDVDILEGRLTVAEVKDNSNYYDDFDVWVFLD